jgi:hypothetical protein
MWMPFGETNVGATADVPGHFSDSQSADGTDFADSKIYWWILKTAGGSPALDLANVNAWGLFSSNNGRWTFPAPGGPPPQNAVALNSAEVNEAMQGEVILNERLVLAPVAGFVLDYQTWAQSAFPLGTLPAKRHQDSDPDGDQLSNGLEWVLATSPLLRDPSPLKVVRTGGAIAVRFARRRALPANSHRLEISGNLMRWNDAFLLAESTIIRALNREMESVELRFDQNQYAGFWRLAFTAE